MTKHTPIPLTETEEKIIDAATRCFVRFGARKTSMNDIAADAGVSRQTIYDLFGGKDELICASIRKITNENLAEVRRLADAHEALAEKLDVYFAQTIEKSFEMIATAGDPEDLISGHNKAGKAEIARSHARHEALIVEFLKPHESRLLSAGMTVEVQAHFLVTVAMGFKYGATDIADLRGLLESLKANCLSIIL